MVAVNSGGRATAARSGGGFTLAEVMVSLAIFSGVGLSLLMGFISLERNYSATTNFALSHGDEMRLSDYMALDFRRALSIDPLQTNEASIYIPAYYDSNDAPVIANLDGGGGVYYGQRDPSGNIATVRVHYYLLNGCVYRKEGNKPTVVLATSVHAFTFPAVTPNDGKVVKTLITFAPKFTYDSTKAITATAFYNTTLLRNKIY